jgi:hypothetical protein
MIYYKYIVMEEDGETYFVDDIPDDYDGMCWPTIVRISSCVECVSYEVMIKGEWELLPEKDRVI